MSRGSRDNNSILSEIEWDEGLSMPVANLENKSLEDEVENRSQSILNQFRSGWGKHKAKLWQ